MTGQGTGRGDAIEQPFDPEVERVRRKILRFLITAIGVTFIAVMAVVALVVYKLEKTSPPRPQVVSDIPGQPVAPGEATITLEPGAKIISQSLSGDRLALDTERADGSRQIVIYDLGQQRVIARLNVATGAK
jgi:hypothetical protein